MVGGGGVCRRGVSDTFARYAGSIFHASSIFGTWLAALASWSVGGQWRFAYLLGVLPALLIVAVRAGVSEPKAWLHAEGGSAGSVWELLAHPVWRKRALPGLLLAAVGLGTFWGVTVAGQDLAKQQLQRQGVPEADAQKTAQLAYGIVETAGGGLGLLSFGPLSVLWGRRRTFIVLQLAALVIVPVACFAPRDYWQLLAILPVYGFFTLGIHAGYADLLSGVVSDKVTGDGSRFLLQRRPRRGGVRAGLLRLVEGLPGMDLRVAVTLLSTLFLVGVLIVCFLPETKDKPLPE